jgi:hypothetical protein
VPAACKLYLTYRTQYLVIHDLCVGVRDRRTSQWLPLHAAACAQLLGPLRPDDGTLVPTVGPRVGERLCLGIQPRQLITGPVIAIEEATPAMVDRAEKQWRELFQPSDPNHTRLVLEPEPAPVITSPKSRSLRRD